MVFKISVKDKFLFLILIIFFLAFGIRLYYFDHCLWVDEARDLIIARNFFKTGHFHFLNNKPDIGHPPLFVFLIGLSSLIFGFSVFSGTLVPILFGSGLVIITYLLGKELYNKRIGLIASFFVAFHPLLWFLSDRVLSNIPNTFFFTLTLFYLTKYYNSEKSKWLYLAFLSAGLSILTRRVSIILPIIIFVVLLEKYKLNLFKKKEFFYGILIFFALFSIWILRNLNEGLLFNFKMVKETFLTANFDVAPWYYYTITLPYNLRIPLFLLFTFGLFTFVFNLRKHKVLLISLILFWILISIIRIKVPRYMSPSVPLFSIIGAYCANSIYLILKKRTLAKIALISIIFIFFYFSYAEATSLIEFKAKGFCGFEEAGAWLKEKTNKNEYILAGSPSQLAFYSERLNISGIPPNQSSLLETIKSKNVTYIEIDAWERTQPQYIFSYVSNNSLFIPAYSYKIEERPVIIIFKINSSSIK